MARWKPETGRLPESIVLSLALHAMIFLVPTTLLARVNALEPSAPKYVQLIHPQSPTHMTQTESREGQKSTSNGKIEADMTAKNDAIAPQLSAPVEPDTHESNSPRDAISQQTRSPELHHPPKAGTPPSPIESIEAAPAPAPLPQAPVVSLAEQERNQEAAEPAPRTEVKVEQRKPALSNETDTPTTESAEQLDDPEEELEQDPPEEPKPDSKDTPPQESLEFVRAPTHGIGVEQPADTQRISDRNMVAVEEERARVHSTEEGSSEYGTQGASASSGRQSMARTTASGSPGRTDQVPRQPIPEHLVIPPPENQRFPSSTPPPQAPQDLAEVLNPSAALGKADPGNSLHQNSLTGGTGPVTSVPASAPADGHPIAPEADIAALLSFRDQPANPDSIASRNQAGIAYRPQLGIQRVGVHGFQQPNAPTTTTRQQSSEVPLQTTSGSHVEGVKTSGQTAGETGAFGESAQYTPGSSGGAQSLASPGHASQTATAPLTVADESIALGDSTRVNAVATPLGRYIATVEDHIRRSWILPMEMRAMGIQGNVGVRFSINRRGHVQHREVVRMSGNSDLDRIALLAIPARLPPIPRELQRRKLEFSYVFRATDSIIAETP